MNARNDSMPENGPTLLLGSQIRRHYGDSLEADEVENDPGARPQAVIDDEHEHAHGHGENHVDPKIRLRRDIPREELRAT